MTWGLSEELYGVVHLGGARSTLRGSERGGGGNPALGGGGNGGTPPVAARRLATSLGGRGARLSPPFPPPRRLGRLRSRIAVRHWSTLQYTFECMYHRRKYVPQKKQAH